MIVVLLRFPCSLRCRDWIEARGFRVNYSWKETCRTRVLVFIV